MYWPARIAALQKALQARGDTLHVIEIAGAGSPYDFAANHSAPNNNIPWTILFPSTKMEDVSPGRARRRLMKKLDELAPDLVMSGSIAFPSGATAVHWARRRNKAVVMFDDARTQNVPRNAFVNYAKRLLYTQIEAVLCPADPWIEDMRFWGFRPDQVFVGVDVVDNDFWAAKSTPPSTPLPEHFFLAVGRLISAKNFMFLLETYRQYLLSDPTRCIIPLLIVGDGPERRAIESYIRNHDIARFVSILPFMDPPSLRTLYQQAAALILPSRSETWGLVVNEAMAAGTPVLVSHACGCASVLVQEGINGFSFSPDAPGQLLYNLICLASLKPSERKAMGLASQRIIRSWGPDRFADGSLQAIDYAMSHHAPPGSLPAKFLLRHWKGRYRPV